MLALRGLSMPSSRGKAVAHAEERGRRAAMPFMGIREKALSSAEISLLTGRRVAKIGLLYDIDLSSQGVPKAGSPEQQRVQEGVLAAARHLRGAFNQASRRQPRFIDCAAIEGLVSRFEEKCTELRATGRVLMPLTDACREVRESCRLEQRGFMPWHKAREGVARILGAARHVNSGQNVAEPQKSAGVVPSAQRQALDYTLTCCSQFANQVSDVVEEGLRLIDPRPMVSTLSRVLGGDVRSHPDNQRSAPTDVALASRRSLCGNKLGALAALESRVAIFTLNPSQETLRPVVEILESWRQGENPSAEGPQQRSLEQLERSPLTIPRTSKQAIFRDAILPALQWGLDNLDGLTVASKRDIVLLLRTSVEALRALTVREIAEEFDVLLYPRHVEPLSGYCTSALLRKVVSFGTLGGAVGAVLTRERDLLAARLDNEKAVKEVVANFRRAGAEKNLAVQKDLASLVRWVAGQAQLYIQEVPQLPAEDALWVSEYDGGQKACLPRELQQRFVEMQKQVQVAAASKQGGFVFPETEEWLQDHVTKHDGFVIAVTAGNPKLRLCSQKPDTIFVGTCSQSSPSPLMEKIAKKAARFIASLPPSSDGQPNPCVVAELAVSNQQAVMAVRSFGEHPTGAAFKQFVFNVVSRFPAAERVDCFATCREGSAAMNAHERMGWRKTGCMYVDEHGTRFDIIHVALQPVEILCGRSCS
jgi:hypothetical protein